MAASAESSRLPVECFLHPESDDEESFVVLGSSLPPESLSIDCGQELTESIDATVVQESLKLTASALSQLSLNAPSFPSMPSINKQDLVMPVQENDFNMTSTTNSSVDLSPDEVQQKLDKLIAENLKLKETLHQNNLAMKRQCDVITSWHEQVMEVQKSHKDKFDQTKLYIDNLKIEKVKLVEALKLSQTAVDSTKQELEFLKSQQNESEAAKEKVDYSFVKSSYDNLREFQLDASQKKIADLDAQVSMLQKAKLEREQLEKQSYASSVSEQVQSLEAELVTIKQQNSQQAVDFGKKVLESDALQKILLEEIKVLKSQLSEKVKTVITKEVHDHVQEQLMQAQMHITKLELLRNEDKEAINAKEETIAKMDTLVKEMTDSSDTMAALRAQLELYKSDFEAERQAKDSVKAEKEQIADDLQHLQRRNQQLLEEVDRLRGGDFVHVNRPEQSAAAAPSAPQDRTAPRFACPKCDFKFWDYQALENHVYRCIEIDSLF